MTMAILGGILIGGAAGAIAPAASDRSWRLLFAGGLVVGGAIAGALQPGAVPQSYAFSTPRLTAAGLLVGVGARLANGCTSGHGLCGVARGSTRSLLATAVFMATGALTVLAVRRLHG